jgi:hypothetical protein
MHGMGRYGGQVGRISDDGMRTAGNAVDLASVRTVILSQLSTNDI